jgi:hypothetical protein
MSREEALKYLIKPIFISILYIKLHLISILYIKNTNETASIVVVFEAIQNTCSRVLSYLKCSCCALVSMF